MSDLAEQYNTLANGGLLSNNDDETTDPTLTAFHEPHYDYFVESDSDELEEDEN